MVFFTFTALIKAFEATGKYFKFSTITAGANRVTVTDQWDLAS